MSSLELIALAVGLSMDAFAVSICKGLNSPKADLKTMLNCGVWFGSFQALMPLLGFCVGTLFAQAISFVDHWIAFGLLGFIGFSMLKEAMDKEDTCESCDDDQSFKTMLTLAIATSIDALAVGESLAVVGNVRIILAVILIGVITLIFSALGVKIGSIFGTKFEKKAQFVGGIILILIGLKILIEHLGLMP
ncbi:MAG: manganese efflux pump MntP family protein [Erysipelotrichaceae bacterium]|nr:manganese efflux pump MntP family protein [Erysipelotrichaceae bacterium]MDY5252865.1 manganese efflux pump MntP family protein [Erysipelotrichaceae bacterium]